MEVEKTIFGPSNPFPHKVLTLASPIKLSFSLFLMCLCFKMTIYPPVLSNKHQIHFLVVIYTLLWLSCSVCECIFKGLDISMMYLVYKW